MKQYYLNHPTKIVGIPRTMAPPCPLISPMQAVGLFCDKTVKHAKATESGGPIQTAISPITAAGGPLIKTVAAVAITGPQT